MVDGCFSMSLFPIGIVWSTLTVSRRGWGVFLIFLSVCCKSRYGFSNSVRLFRKLVQTRVTLPALVFLGLRVAIQGKISFSFAVGRFYPGFVWDAVRVEFICFGCLRVLIGSHF